MAFLDKLNDLAKTIGDKTTEVLETTKAKTSEMIENTKANSRIHSEEEELEKLMGRLGSAWYEKYQAGEALDTAEIQEILDEIAERKQVIAEIEQARAEAEAERARAEAEAEAARAEAERARAEAEGRVEAEVREQAADEEGLVCPSCGKVNSGAARFCCECGTRLEEKKEEAAPDEERVEPKVCPNCQAVVQDGVKFCSECGTKIE